MIKGKTQRINSLKRPLEFGLGVALGGERKQLRGGKKSARKKVRV